MPIYLGQSNRAVFNMEITLFLFLIAAGILFSAIRLLSSQTSTYERFFLVCIIGILSYAAYDNTVKNKLNIVTTEKQVKSILNLIEDSLEASGVRNITLHVPLQKILESDPQFLKALLALIKYYTYDKDAVVEIIKDLTQFYDIYADVLLEAKPHTTHISTLVSIRFKLIEHMHALFVSLPNNKNTHIFEYISLVLQSTTYKALNVLKNKYGTTAHETPLPENAANDLISI